MTDPTDATRRILTVSELTGQIKSLLENSFAFVWVCGEISNFRTPGSCHYYFTLKDEGAQVAAVMFRNQNRQLKFMPADGMGIIGLGRISVYEPRGSYQIILEYVEPAGVGALQIAFEKLKQRLASQGYFDERHKQRLPFLPRKISVITSPTGAVVQDIITVASRRFPNMPLQIVPVKVQGAGSEDEIAAALELVNAHSDADVIILARGGGSLEDLQAFNSERVAMAIFNSRIPVVSAVGHETDFTIADFVADLRAPTPSAAAELVVPDKNELAHRYTEIYSKLQTAIANYLSSRNKTISDLAHRLKDPRKKVQELWIRIDDMIGRLRRLSAMNLKREYERWGALSRRLQASSPIHMSQKAQLELERTNNNLLIFFKILLEKNQSSLREARAKLEALNPMAVLRRGYSVTRRLPDGRVVTDPNHVVLGQDIEVLVAEGSLFCNVKGASRYGKEKF
ncbi:MAG: exodeoxyribonuclease VII large subunit [Deltaproteobacteria bacterium]|nr:exodeoxyribonuclease VII large subunit [Deltaproteobacteria bacterium]